MSNRNNQKNQHRRFKAKQGYRRARYLCIVCQERWKMWAAKTCSQCVGKTVEVK